MTSTPEAWAADGRPRLPDKPFVILERAAMLDSALLERYRSVPTATVGHRFDGRIMDPGIRALVPGRLAVGPALTIRTCGRDSTIVHKAIGLISPGDVLVIDRCGDTRYACVGEMMAIAAERRGAAGIVIDGPATDVGALRARGLPIFSRATSPVTTLLLGVSGSINVPVTCGGVAVRPGELVLADDDGVIVLDADEAATLLAGVLEEDREDAEYRDELLAGRLPVELAPIDQLIGEANDHA